MNPNVTILLPYNKDRGFLQQAYDSASKQALVIPCHSDGTVGHNINHGLAQVKTKYWCAIAEDDLLTPDSIESRFAVIEQGYDFIHARAVTFWNGGEAPYSLTSPYPTIEEMLRINKICGGTPMYKTDLCQKFGMWDESLTTGEEYDWHLKLIHGGASIGFCDKVVYKWRRHDLQKSLGNKSREYQDRRQVVIKGIRSRYA